MDEPTVKVSVLLPLPVLDGGLKLAVVPDGSPEIENEINVVGPKPLAVMVLVAVLPWITVMREFGESLMLCAHADPAKPTSRIAKNQLKIERIKIEFAFPLAGIASSVSLRVAMR